MTDSLGNWRITQLRDNWYSADRCVNGQWVGQFTSYDLPYMVNYLITSQRYINVAGIVGEWIPQRENTTQRRGATRS